jgi:alkylated DNA repair dioxygenase AlkB
MNAIEALPPPGIEVHGAFVDAGRAAQLRERALATLDWSSPEVRLFGRRHRVPRRLAFVAPPGAAYAYSGLRHEGTGIPDWLAPLVEAVARATGFPFDSVLATHYRDGGDRLGWHADAEPELGADPAVAILSLGAPRTLAFRRTDPAERAAPDGRWRVRLGDGDLLCMAPGVQRRWQHAVPKRAHAGERVSFGFRALGTR